jgi:glutaredoxin 3
MADVLMYTTAWCGYCTAAKAFLRSKSVEFTEVDLGDDPAFRQRLLAETGGWTVPQIVIGKQPVGGYRELRQLEAAGRLDELLSNG